MTDNTNTIDPKKVALQIRERMNKAGKISDNELVEKEKNEAGMLKALGIGKKEIRKLYFSKYILLSIIIYNPSIFLYLTTLVYILSLSFTVTF